MVKREKRIEKQIEGLKEIRDEHKNKLRFEKGQKDTTHDYWKKEIEGFNEQIELLVEKLRKIKNKENH